MCGSGAFLESYIMNGWKRIGIILSVVWILGAGYWQRRDDMQTAGRMASWSMEVCQKGLAAKNSYDFSSCDGKFYEMFEVFSKHSWGNVAILALAPIPILWLVAYLVVGLVRWVRRGFPA